MDRYGDILDTIMDKYGIFWIPSWTDMGIFDGSDK